jgi:rhamnose utilization protein RhaD (predicted bifunctional aldolase and dehydrogenase)
MFPEEVRAFGAQAVYVPYSDPGAPLAREIVSRVDMSLRRVNGTMPRLILLQNIGILALGASVEAVLRTVMVADRAAAVFVGSSRLSGPLFLPRQQVTRLELLG